MTYYVLTEVKRICGIDQADTTFDTLLNELGAKADKRVDSALFPYASVIPLAGTELVTESRTELANLNTAKLYAIEAHDQTLKNDSKEEYKEALQIFVDYLKAIPTTRTKAVLVAKDPRESKMVLPTQAAIFAFDDWA
jgi:hypothetical protein